MKPPNDRFRKKRIVEKYLSLRCLVAFLGEKNQFNWWSTTAMSKTGSKYHAMLFPRTSGLSALHQSLAGAREHHDRSVSLRKTYHLFRLPSELEESIYQSAAREIPVSQEMTRHVALTELEATASQNDLPGDGPVRIGGLNQVRLSKSLELIAGCYLRSFRTGQTSIPFFADA